MKSEWLLGFAILAFAARLAGVVRLWTFPGKNGDGWLFGRRIDPAAYATNGFSLIRRYRAALLIGFLFDTPIAVWLGSTDRLRALVGEQFIALVLNTIANNLVLAHFASRVAALARPNGERPGASIQVSMSPRRLRDHTNPAVELAIGALLGVSLALAQQAHAVSAEPWVTWNAAKWLRSIDSVAAWLLYLQVGLLLLKVVFIRWRMPLPARRTDDFRRWRTTWLTYHLRLFDSMRLLFALALLSAIFWLARAPDAAAALGAGWVVTLAAFAAYWRRERSHLASVAKEVKPLELAGEFPQSGVPEGRFMLGFLYISRDNPGVLVRSGSGIALNVGHPATYVWAAYLFGLIVLVTWVTG